MKKFKDIKGRLLWAEPDPNTGFTYIVWFDYTRQLMNSLHEGDLVAVPNFGTDKNGTRYSILQLVNVMPRHYALGTDMKDLKGYPGFVMQAAKSASADWTEQESEPYEETTKIICEAIPTNLECYDNNDNIMPETSPAMVGKDAMALESEIVEKIFNMGINKEEENVIVAGSLIRDDGVKIYVRVEDLIKTHFGIFGFTGVGKSNLISTLISNLLFEKESNKIVLFDLMDEYTGMLIDQILEKGKIICLGEKTLSRPVFDYINNPSTENLEPAINSFLKGFLLPKGLKGDKNKFKPLISKMLIEGKVKIFEENLKKTVESFLEENWPNVINGLRSNVKIGKLNKMKKAVFGSELKDEITPLNAQKFIEEFKGFQVKPKASVTDILDDPDLKSRIEFSLIEPLKEIVGNNQVEYNEEATIDLYTIINDLNSNNNSSLYLITSHHSDKIREFANNLGRNLFNVRRLRGTISPVVSFVFDEADQFIPGSPRSNTKEALSKAIIETLTRRGRKFGIGIGIATQRSAYLDTNIMGQLHTYFISKLPREYDRKVVGEAFSLSPDQFTQTFKFKKGQWLLISHEATGIDMPIPFYSFNAEERIKEYIKNFSDDNDT